MIKKMPIPYIYCILIGTGLGILLGLRHYISLLYWGEVEKFNWMRYFAPYFINNALWGFIVPLVYYFAHKFDLSKNSPFSDKAKAILASVAVAAFHEAISYVVWFFPSAWLTDFKFDLKEFELVVGAFPAGFISRLVEYWLIYGVFAAFDYSKKYKNKQIELAQMESQLANAQLSALRLQLHPHFLFNTLNSISSLIDLNTKEAQKMVSKLVTLLRTVLDKDKRQMIPLREELEFVRNYLGIEQMRFHDRLEVKYDIDQKLLEVKVPSMILQPLVENAIKHGFSKKTGEGKIEIKAQSNGGHHIKLAVKDDGRGVLNNEKLESADGIGLKNVKERLELIYRKKASIEVNSAVGKGFEVILSIPINPN